MKLAGVVVLYNPDETVIQNVKSYLPDLDVLYLVDNSNTDNSDMFTELNNVEYIPLMKNTGIAYALNIGAKEAIKNGYEWLLTMDQDSEFENHGVSLMKEYIQKHDYLYKTGLYTPYHLTSISQSRPIEIYSYALAVMTSGNIINLDIYQKIGGFKEWMFIDCVDFDYCLNLRKHGYEVVQINRVVLNHGLGNYTVEKLFGKNILCDNHNAIRRYYIIRNGLYLNKMYKNFYPMYCKVLRKGIRTSFYIVPLCEKDGWKKLRYMIKGWIDFKKGIAGELNV